MPAATAQLEIRAVATDTSSAIAGLSLDEHQEFASVSPSPSATSS
jgi:hypothetical protein